MKERRYSVVVCVVILALALVAFDSLSVSNMELDDFTVYLDERITQLMKYYDIPGVNIALIQGGEVAWVNAYGYADMEIGRLMTTDTYCRVQSISKSITSWGVMKLVEQGKINLDCPINYYIKSWEFPQSELSYETITVRQLLSHNAGLPIGDVMDQYSPTSRVPSLRENLFQEFRLVQESGRTFIYSNVGFNLLELIIEEVTGLDFSTYMEREVFNPLEMRSSTFTWSSQLYPEVPVGYNTKGQPIPVYVYPGKASGGLFSSVEDIARFVSAGMGENSVLSHESLQKLYTPVIDIKGVYRFITPWYGLGYFVEPLSDNLQGVWHGGQGNGLMTHFHAVPETGDGIVILTNSQRSWPFIAHILTDWAKWNGFSSPGMRTVLMVKKGLEILIILSFIIILYLLWRLLREVTSGRRRFELLAKQMSFKRLIQIGIFALSVGILWWCLKQDYLFMTSVFPTRSIWLGVLLLGTGLVSLVYACFPCVKKF